jgi:membrane-associated phospholipid phosphatase
MSAAGRAARACALAVLFAAPPPARAAEPLDVEPARDGAILGVSAGTALALTLLARPLTPAACRWCDPGRLDTRFRDALRWHDARRAALASDLLANVLLPAAAVGETLGAAWGDGGWRQAGEDAVVVAEAVLVAVDLNQAAKIGFARLRPNAWAAGTQGGVDSRHSFYSGHTSFAFSLAASVGTVASMRRYRAAPWIWGVGMALAAGVGWLRVGADAHWMTDVVAGAAVGGAVGFAVPWMLHRPRTAGASAVELYPAPGGFALRW